MSKKRKGHQNFWWRTRGAQKFLAGGAHAEVDPPLVKHISDLFIGCRPDLVIVSSNRISVCELTVCHETNLHVSRDYKLNKCANLASSRSSLVSQLPVKVYTIEVSTLGFVAAEPNFFKDCAVPFLSNTILTEIIKTTALASHDIYGKR